VQVPVEIGTYLLNEKRNDISVLEKTYGVQVLVIPNPHLKTPHYYINKDQ
jgi:ribonuclease E